MDLKNISNEHKPIPFWSWNEKLSVEETKRQAAEMARIGMGGFFMHARGGLQTEYMSEEWFQNIEAGISEAEKHGIKAWVYDENGWPSGFGGGIVNGMGEKYQQKYLRMEKESGRTENVIAVYGGTCFYYEINPFYTDTLDKNVVKEFIDKVYKPYYDRYKNRIAGFFTDEPQISRNGIPWSYVLEEEYKKNYGEALIPHLEELFSEKGDYKNTRIKFWRLVTKLFSESYMKQIYDWCEERGLKLTGHLSEEDNLTIQITSNGACMPHYEYMHIPGVDWLGRDIGTGIIALQGCSAAQQLGKKQFLSESFALCGHNASFSEFRKIVEWQMVRGVTLLCPHLEGYSIRGIRKRDYPPAMYEQQPWWEDYSRFLNVISRTGMILSEGEVLCETLIIHPESMAWAMFNGEENRGIDKIEEQFEEEIKCLDRKHAMFHLGDEILMERHAHVEKNELVIGTQRYKRVVMLPGQSVMKNTQRLLDEFAENGGLITTAEKIEENKIIDNPDILYTARKIGDKTVHYFVNVTGKKQTAFISAGAKKISAETGDISEFDGFCEFNEYDSILVLDDGTERKADMPKKSKNKPLHLGGEWEIVKASENALTLDRCTYYFDGVLCEENGYVLNIAERACALKRKVNIRMEYHVEINSVPKNAGIAIETPDIFKIWVNGRELEKKDCGFFRDRSFRKLDISGMLSEGENVITLETEFCQSERVYENIEKASVFESEKNKLTYDMEIEPIYLIGDFSVSAKECKEISEGVIRCSGFSIEEPKKKISLKNIESSGFLFFAGELILEKCFELEDTDYSLSLARLGGSAVHARVNDGGELVSIWNSDVFDIKEYLRKGKNKITLRISNNLRNLLGPHHLEIGESFSVNPKEFYKEKCVWNNFVPVEWNEAYAFVRLSMEEF